MPAPRFPSQRCASCQVKWRQRGSRLCRQCDRNYPDWTPAHTLIETAPPPPPTRARRFRQFDGVTFEVMFDGT